MKSFIVFALIIAAAVAAPANTDAEAQVVRSENNPNIGDGLFNTGFETSNGISSQAQGQQTNVGTENEGAEIRGQYSYTGPDNVVYTVTYIANELGFQPQGAHLPKA